VVGEVADDRHGGPGGGVASSDTVYFDPKVYRIVLFDQRGAGKSEPYVQHARGCKAYADILVQQT
jgi:pimeloyl-ACP methyl ester carboxylesterase